ncbi:hypothetical protein T02_1441 [Trichinella nativa]|uniref:Uncharacterized protein n=1 Tax=Trichinella nativa TaxID=6335 RepID=A0A0V1LLB7_9BILA|nr:hypothetical protein T02_1441 [Trichinella nativa]
MMIIPVRIIPAVNGKFKNVASSSVCGTSVEAKIKAKAPPIDKERTPRNSDWIERYRTEKTECRCAVVRWAVNVSSPL